MITAAETVSNRLQLRHVTIVVSYWKRYFVDRVTRKELKADRFAQEVGHTVEYVSEHRKQVIRYGTIAAAVLVVVIGVIIAIVYWLR